MNLAALGRLVRAGSTDGGVLWGLAGKLWTGFAGLVTAALITYAFTPELQGYHYAFLSLLGLQIVVELGVSTVITVFASHEWSSLRLTEVGAIEGERTARSRLASVLRFGMGWFGIGALCLGGGLALVGSLFFIHSPQQQPAVAWQGPWLALCLTTAITVTVAPAWAILIGCNQVSAVNYCRLVEGVLRSACLWVALLAGAQLWSVPIAAVVALPWMFGFLWVRYGRFFATLLREQVTERVHWRREMLPMQWRIAVSWLAGYFSFYLFVPALFWFQGPIVAGQMGMTWAIVMGVSGLAGTWMQVKTPQFAMFVAQRDFAALERLRLDTTLLSVAASVAGALALLGLLWILERLAPGLRDRLLPWLPVGILLLAETLHQISMVQSTCLRAFKQEPFFALSVTSALIIGGGTIVSARFFGATGVALSYLFAIVVALVWGMRILEQHRRNWTGV